MHIVLEGHLLRHLCKENRMKRSMHCACGQILKACKNANGGRNLIFQRRRVWWNMPSHQIQMCRGVAALVSWMMDASCFLKRALVEYVLLGALLLRLLGLVLGHCKVKEEKATNKRFGNLLLETTTFNATRNVSTHHSFHHSKDKPRDPSFGGNRSWWIGNLVSHNRAYYY